VTALLLAPLALMLAQVPDQPPPRSGVRVALDAGVGYIAPYSCQRCARFQGGGPELAMDLGGTLTPELALLASFAVTILPFPDQTTAFDLQLMGGLQRWIFPSIYLRGAAGVGWRVLEKDGYESSVPPMKIPPRTLWYATGAVAGGAVGYEIRRRTSTFGAHAELRALGFIGQIFTGHLALLMGVSWH
jgi:hypothetical protein